MDIVLTHAVVAVAILMKESWSRGKTHGELSPKHVQITHGSFVAFWPLYLSWHEIIILSLVFVGGILLSQQLNIFKAIHSVQRPTWGEVFFGLSVGMVAVITHNPAVYAVALLHMSLADGFAAVVGARYGASNAYQVFGHRKSVAGSVTFAVVSALILTGFALHQHTGFEFVFIPLILGAAILENFAVRGIDNLLVPLMIAFVLSQTV
jgi:phytol kinase